MLLGLGLAAGAVLQRPAPLAAQDTARVRRDTLKIPVPVRADSILHRDTLARRDSLARRDTAKVKRDTIKAPLAHAEMPATPAIGQQLRWNRAELFATGALTVQDLVGRVTGVTPMGAGWIAAPAVAAYLGDTRRVRVFIDGVERDELDPRAGGPLDLTQINLWTLEDAAIEQGAGEVRVYLRSWRVVNTSPSTRTDIGTGDQQTNMYRGFFGRRYDGGTAIQFGAQQFGTTPPSRFGTTSDQLGLFGRAGWAVGRWSVDASATRTSRHRGVITPETIGGDSIPSVDSQRSDMYLRLGLGDPDTSGFWAQALAAGSKYQYTGIKASTDTATVSLDTSAYRSQYVLSVGASQLGARVSATQRFRAGAGPHVATPSVRGSYSAGPLALSAFLEGKGPDSIAHQDVVAQIAPLPFISFLGAAGRSADNRVKDSTFTTSYVRGEAGLRLRDLWLIGGLIRRDSLRLTPPRIFDTVFTRAVDASATGITAAIRGRVWGPVNANVSAIRWTDSLGFYRPQYQTRSEVFVATNLIERFPTGNFGLLASAIHEYRSGTRFPTRDSVATTVGYRTISLLVEIRILDAVASYQFRNLIGERYQQVPGFAAPRQTQFYGVRWAFWN